MNRGDRTAKNKDIKIKFTIRLITSYMGQKQRQKYKGEKKITKVLSKLFNEWAVF